MQTIDENIWKRIQKEDEKAFEILFYTFYSSLCFYANQIIHNHELSEELVQDVFLKIWQSHHKIEIKSSIRAYLYQAVHNQAINTLKQQSANKLKVNQLTGDAIWKFIEDTYFIDEYLLEKLEASETEELINKIISQLPEQCREIFILSRFEGKTNQEISEIFQITENSVRTQLYRALTKIKEALEK